MCVFALLGLILPYALAVEPAFPFGNPYCGYTAADCRSWLGCHSACHAGGQGSLQAKRQAG